MYIFFAGLMVLTVGISTLYWTIKHFNYEIHKYKVYIKDPTPESIDQVLIIFFSNFILRRLPVKVMQIILIMFSIGLFFFSAFIFSLLFYE